MHTMIASAVSAALAQASPIQPAIEGRWINPDRTVIVDIAQCENSLCGTVVWATEKAKQDARKGAPTLVGTQLLTGLRPSGKDWRGKLFVPDRKVRVTAKIRLSGDRQLRVTGCTIGGLICNAQVWTRADGPLPQKD
jgi:uncharacterized protein (DUF2147 family)